MSQNSNNDGLDRSSTGASADRSTAPPTTASPGTGGCYAGRAALPVPRLVLGTGTFGREVDGATARRLIDRYLDAGGSMLDVADAYTGGRAEEIVGAALGSRRSTVTLCTKIGNTDPDGGAILDRRHVARSLEASLRRLRTDWIDVLFLHRWGDAPPEETLDAVDRALRSGVVRHIATSNLSAWQLAWLDHLAGRDGVAAPVLTQVEYSLIQRDVEAEIVEYARCADLPLAAWSPLGGGLLAGAYGPDAPRPAGTRADGDDRAASLMRSRTTARNLAIAATVREVAAAVGATPAQVALAWVLGRPGVTAAVIGARTLEQLDENLAADGLSLPEAARSELDRAGR